MTSCNPIKVDHVYRIDGRRYFRLTLFEEGVMEKSQLADLLPTAWEEIDVTTGKKLAIHAFSADHVWLTKKTPPGGFRTVQAIWEGYKLIGWWAINDRGENLQIKFRVLTNGDSLFDLPGLALAKTALLLVTAPLRWLDPYPQYFVERASDDEIHATMYERAFCEVFVVRRRSMS
jgi:hypothetical protein